MATKLIKAKIRKFKPIENFETEVDGHNFWLIGENSTGKSSFQQLLKIAMGDANSIPQNMIADGHFWLDKDGQQYQSKVEAKNGKVSIKVTLPDGSVEDKKTVIRGLFGGVNFDIQEFVGWSKTAEGRRKQVVEFKKTLTEEFINGLAAFEKKAKAIYDDRTEIGQKIKTLKGFISESKLFGEDLNVKEVDTKELAEDLSRINTYNEKVKGTKQRFEDRSKKIDSNKAKIEELKAEMEKIRLETIELERVTIIEENTQIEAAKWIESHPLKDTSSIVEAMNNASSINVKASQAAEHNKKLAQLTAFEEDYNELTVQYETTKQAISDAIKDFGSPVEGLSFDADQLIYNGNVVDDKSLSTSEIIELGCKMAIAKNPDCGILFVSQGESIGNERLKIIKDLAKKNNWQLIGEQVVRGKEKLEVELMIDN